MAARPSFPLRETLSFMGAMIGAGVFALPAAMNRVGILQGSLMYWALAGVVLAGHLLYAEVILARTDMKPHRLPGQVGLLFGRWFRGIAFVTQPLHIIGACLVYLIIGGEFLSVIASFFGVEVPLLAWQIFFCIGGAFTVLYGLRMVVRVESVLTKTLIVFMSALVIAYLMRAEGSGFLVWRTDATLLPLGVFVFAMFGLTFVPEIVEIGQRRRRTVLLSIACGTLIAAFLMWLFAVSAAGADPNIQSPADLVRSLPAWIAWAIPVVGFLAVSSVFITQTQDLRATFEYDAKLRPMAAFALSIGAPLLLLLTVTHDFLTTVSIVGAVFNSINMMFVAAMALKLRIAPVVAIALFTIFLFILGSGILSILSM